MIAAFAPEAVQDIIIGLTMLGCGLGIYLGVLNFADYAYTRNVESLGFGLARIGTTIVIALIAELVSKAPDVPLTWRAVLYSVGLLMVAVGFILIALGHRRRNRATP